MYQMETSASHEPTRAGTYLALADGHSCVPVRIFLSTRSVMSYIRTPYLSNLEPAAPI